MSLNNDLSHKLVRLSQLLEQERLALATLEREIKEIQQQVNGDTSSTDGKLREQIKRQADRLPTTGRAFLLRVLIGLSLASDLVAFGILAQKFIFEPSPSTPLLIVNCVVVAFIFIVIVSIAIFLRVDEGKL